MLKKGEIVDLKELQKLSGLQTKAGPKNAKLYLERIRKNLMTLMCQTDVVELSGDLNAFGGDKDVTANISKAVFGLFCVGNVLGVDVAQGIEKHASVVMARLTPPSSSSTDSAVTETDRQTAPGTTEKKGGTPPDASSQHTASKPDRTASAKAQQEQKEQDTSKSQSSSRSSDNKAKKIENYKLAFKSPKDKAAIELVWKDISEDEELSGQDKYQLQNDKKEALKRVAA